MRNRSATLLFILLSYFGYSQNPPAAKKSNTTNPGHSKTTPEPDKPKETINKKVPTDKITNSTVNKTESNIKKPEAVGKNPLTTEKKPETTKTKEADDFTVYSGFDFIPGENVVFYDDFYQDSIGSFPSKWHTYGTGKLVKLPHNINKWFKLNTESAYIPEIANRLSDVYTIQFDMLINAKNNLTQPVGSIFFSVLSYEGGNGLESDGIGGGKVEIHVAPAGYSTYHAKNWYPNQKDSVDTKKYDNILDGKLGKPVRVSICVNRRRYKIYIDNKKIFDFGKFVPEGIMYDKFRIHLTNFSDNQPCEIFVSNFRMASNIPNIKHILSTKERLVTTGVLFDVGSDKIKNISYGTLKAIAEALKENPQLRVKIIGHTDSNGDEKINLLLSQKRAESVKNYLVKYFQINAMRLTTDGKGEYMPIGTNSTPEGRANNRRVEFLKN